MQFFLPIIDIELKRREIAQHLTASKKRERHQEDEEKAAKEAEEELNKNWSNEERREGRIGNWRDFQGNHKRVAAKNFKQEENSTKKAKYGTADMESWKKQWK